MVGSLILPENVVAVVLGDGRREVTDQLIAPRAPKGMH